MPLSRSDIILGLVVELYANAAPAFRGFEIVGFGSVSRFTLITLIFNWLPSTLNATVLASSFGSAFPASLTSSKKSTPVPA